MGATGRSGGLSSEAISGIDSTQGPQEWRQRTLFGTKCVGTGVLFATWRETGRLQRDNPGVNNSSATKPEL
jgi:hypothetical protein